MKYELGMEIEEHVSLQTSANYGFGQKESLNKFIINLDCKKEVYLLNN